MSKKFKLHELPISAGKGRDPQQIDHKLPETPETRRSLARPKFWKLANNEILLLCPPIQNKPFIQKQIQIQSRKQNLKKRHDTRNSENPKSQKGKENSSIKRSPVTAENPKTDTIQTRPRKRNFKNATITKVLKTKQT